MNKRQAEKESIDEYDRKIINELLLNAKLPLRELATRVKLSFVTVMNRIRRMEREGIIKRYAATIDYSKLGYDLHVLIQIRIAKGKLLELEKRLAKFPMIYSVYDVTGDFDAIAVGMFKTTRSLDEFVKSIQTFDFVERTNTVLILNTIKEGVLRV